MKAAKTTMLLIAAALFVIGMGGTSFAFHAGGVAECEGCHTMHNSLGGVAEIAGKAVGVANASLLKGTDQSSTCLECHGQPDAAPNGYHILTSDAGAAGGKLPMEMTPGGDFAWLGKTFTWVSRGEYNTSEGSAHGHNIYAADFGLTGDVRMSKAPGGDYSAGPTFGCQSCHDPHGRARKLDSTDNFSTSGKPIRTSGSYGLESGDAIVPSTMAVGAYRLLGGVNYAPKSYDLFPFSQKPMIAAVSSSYNRTENTSSTKVAYGKGTSQWCANCHGAMHLSVSTVPGALVHPNDQVMSAEVLGNYNKYKKTGDWTATQANSYTSLAPFQSDQYTSNATLSTIYRQTTAGPLSGDRVVCQSCHRSHASGWDSMLRWAYTTTFMTVADSGGTAIYADKGVSGQEGTAMGRTSAEIQRAYYDRPATTFAPYQRVFCNKCHTKD
jgi:hypothetical protein